MFLRKRVHACVHGFHACWLRVSPVSRIVCQGPRARGKERFGGSWRSAVTVIFRIPYIFFAESALLCLYDLMFCVLVYVVAFREYVTGG